MEEKIIGWIIEDKLLSGIAKNTNKEIIKVMWINVLIYCNTIVYIKQTEKSQ